MTQFEKYIEDGQTALETHPDYSDFAEDETDSIACDVIASILHRVDAERGLSPTEARDRDASGEGNAWALLERAYRSYVGDFEDIAK